MTTEVAAPQEHVCSNCGCRHPAAALSCPSCNSLTHANELQRLATEARAAEEAGNPSEALAAWRHALDLLPPGTRQHQTIAQRVIELSRQIDSSAHKKKNTKIPKWLGGLGLIGLALWKFKFILVWVLTKAKFLIFGLSKSGTILSMILSLGVYWAAFGWKFAAGLIASIYIHEMGHVAALHRYGIKASAPMFIPGLGAVIRSHQYPSEPREDARVGLAGPIYGLGAAVAAWLIYLATGWASLAAIAKIGAWINIFNLIPIPPLDGGRGFRALMNWQRWLVAAAFGAAFYFTQDGLVMLLAIVAVVRCFQKGAPENGDGRAFGEFVFLIAALAALIMIEVPV